MIGTEPLHVDASNGQILRAWTHDDPGRCIQIVPMNLMDEAFDAVEFCMPEVETPPDAGVMTTDAGWNINDPDSGIFATMDAGAHSVNDAGTITSHPHPDSGSSSAGSVPPTTADGGTATPVSVDEGCGCAQTPTKGSLHLGWLILFCWVLRRRFNAA